MNWLHKNCRLGLHNLLYVFLKVLSKQWGDLIQASDQSVTVCWVALSLSILSSARTWNKGASHAFGEEAFLVPLDKPEVMAESIYNEAMKIMTPIHDQLDAARKFLDELEADDDDNDDDETNNSNETEK